MYIICMCIQISVGSEVVWLHGYNDVIMSYTATSIEENINNSLFHQLTQLKSSF